MQKPLETFFVVLILLLCTACTLSPSSSDQEEVTGGPSISASYIDTILDKAGSPAKGLGAELYQLSSQYQIDDTVALAFFHHESSYGLYGVARATRNFGNIRCAQGYTCDPTGGYRSYPTWADGAKDWYQLLSTVYIARGLDTVGKIVPVYAPSEDGNSESVYIQSVENDVQLYRSGEAPK